MQIDDLNNPKYKGFYHCFKEIYTKEGYSKLFKGFTPCVVKSIPVNAFGFLVFEQSLKIMGIGKKSNH